MKTLIVQHSQAPGIVDAEEPSHPGAGNRTTNCGIVKLSLEVYSGAVTVKVVGNKLS